jgi:hypothetical protein
MKSTLFIAVAAALSTAVVGTPTLSGLEAREAEAEAAGLVPRVSDSLFFYTHIHTYIYTLFLPFPFLFFLLVFCFCS